MSLLAIPYPVIDPVMFQVGPLAIRWYSMAYIGGLLFAWYYMAKQASRSPDTFLQFGQVLVGYDSPLAIRRNLNRGCLDQT